MSDLVEGLVLGGGVVDRRLPDPAALLLAYRDDIGTRYLNHVAATPLDRLYPEDLAVTILINSRVSSRAWVSVADLGFGLDLRRVPAAPLEATTATERDEIADVIATVASWPGFAASVATKVLHKKRPASVPILDNQAIFGAYMSPTWPERPSSQDSVKDVGRIRDALERIAFDLVRSENGSAWSDLRAIEPQRTGIELFDMIWWMWFRRLEPVVGSAPK